MTLCGEVQKGPTVYSEIEIIKNASVDFSEQLDEIFRHLVNDQSTFTPSKPLFRSTWKAFNKNKLSKLQSEYKLLDLSKADTISELLNTVETLAYTISQIVKEQMKELKVVRASNNSSLNYYCSGKSINTLVINSYCSGLSFISDDNGSSVISGDITYRAKDHQTLMKLIKMNMFSSPELSLFSDDISISVGGKQLRRSDTSIVLAEEVMDDVLLAIFNLRYSNSEPLKAVKALCNMSMHSVKNQEIALSTMSEYCSRIVEKEDLSDALELFNYFCLNGGGDPLYRLVMEFIDLEAANREIISLIVSSLSEQAVTSLKSAIKNGINSDKFDSISNTVELISYDQEYRSWCIKQITPHIKSKILNGRESSAAELIESYLMKYPETKPLGAAYYYQIINDKIGKKSFSSADEYIEKLEPYLMDVAKNFTGTEAEIDILMTFVDEMSNAYCCDKVITILSLAKIQIEDQEAIKKMAKVLVNKLQYSDSSKANLVKVLFLS